MGIFLGWIIFSIIVGSIGNSRNIGFAGAFFLSLLLSPLIGLIITLISKDKQEEKYKEELLKTQKETLSNIKETKTSSVSDELIKLKKLLDDGVINQEEFDVQKNKLLSKS